LKIGKINEILFLAFYHFLDMHCPLITPAESSQAPTWTLLWAGVALV